MSVGGVHAGLVTSSGGDGDGDGKRGRVTCCYL